eukprot:gnl/Trimastix_PCT/1698.p1 GENE.gnl/Trimastix_PCT/1698~~gnl/Trimastix_PCT/1698.p1  ORF type:complete len:882 (-),score=383.37 gnl/Trimastix_PCT/1698:206-2851(-)
MYDHFLGTVARRMEDESRPEEEGQYEVPPGYEEDDPITALIDPDNPIIASVQSTIEAQLKEHDERLELDLREKNEELRTISQEHETLGVELYGVQQELARMFTDLNKLSETHQRKLNERQTTEESLVVVSRTLEEKRTMHHETELKVARTQDELDRLNLALKQVGEYTQSMQDEILLMRRQTYRLERDLVDREKEKKGQDFLVDHLSEQINKSQEQYGLYEAQLIAQQQETRAATETLAEASIEKDSILMEQKQLMTQYKKSITGMQRRDEALQQTEEALRKQDEQTQTLLNETRGFKQQISATAEDGAAKARIMSKILVESRFLKDQLQKIQHKREAMSAEFMALRRESEQLESAMGRSQQDAHHLDKQRSAIQFRIQNAFAEQHKVQEQIHENLDEQSAYERTASSTSSNADKLRVQIREKQLQAASLSNEISCVRLDILNTQAHTESLQKALNGLLSTLKEKDDIIVRYGVLIRRKNDEIAKKQAEVDKLNRRLYQRTQNKDDENKGPLEATIYNLKRDIEKKTEECSDLERQWMRRQVNLLSLTKQAQKIEANIRDMTAQQTVLRQRGLRLDTTCAAENREITELDHGISKMHTEMQRLNGLISKNTALQEQLASGNFNLEAEFVSRLKELEREAIRLEQLITETKATKERMMNEIVETERQMMLWERKIELERETQATLDPSKHAGEVQEMEKEIHRMQLRYHRLCKEQEELVQHMQKTIVKWGFIAQQGRTRARTGMTQAGLKTSINDVQRRIRAATQEGQRFEQELQALNDGHQETLQTIERTSVGVDQLREQQKQIQEEVAALLIDKQKNLDRITRIQRFCKRYDAEAAGTYRPSCKPEDLDAQLRRQTGRKQALDTAIEELRQQFPFIQLVS